MNPFSRLFGRKSVEGPRDLYRELLLLGSSKSGVPVNWRTALQLSTVFACCRVIAAGMSQVPIKLYREMPNNGREVVKDHNCNTLLHRQPNEFQTAFTFWNQRALHLALCGNAFALIVRVGNRVVELLPYEPQQVTVKRNGWDISYEVSGKDGERILVGRADMWHSTGPSWDGVVGLEVVKLAREAIGLGLATEKHGSLLFANGAQPGGILSTDASLTTDQQKALKESWQEAQSGDNKFKTAAMWGGMKWSPMSTPNDQAQFLETRRLQVEEVCRDFRVLPIMIGHSDKTATYASASAMFEAHIIHTMAEWYRNLEQCADMALLTKKEIDDGYYFKFSASAFMRGSVKDRGDFYQKMYNIGVLNPNQIRAFEEWNPYDGGDEYRVPLNMAEPGKDTQDDPEASGDAGGKDNATP